MPAEQDPQLLKGVLSLLLLHVLAERESYGYEVVHRLREIGLSDIAAGTVYPALSRLEREQRLTARLVASSEGPARKTTGRPQPDTRPSRRATAWTALANLPPAQPSRPVPPPSKGH